MLEGLKNMAAAQSAKSPNGRSIESVALAAVQGLIANRDKFRNRANRLERELASLRDTNQELQRSVQNQTGTQEGELAAMRAANAELHRKINLIRRHYMDLATEFVAQLQRSDRVIQEALVKPAETRNEPKDAQQAAPPMDEAAIVALAKRFAPETEPSPRPEAVPTPVNGVAEARP